MMTAGSLQSGMQQFYGTENYYFSPFNKNVNYTDGVKWFLESAECYWLLDIIVTEVYQAAKAWTAKEGDTFFKIETHSFDSKATIKVTSTDQYGSEHTIFSKEITFTDLPEGNWVFYYCNNVVMLPTEY